MKNWKYIGWDNEDGLPCVLAFNPHAGEHAAHVPPNVTPLSAGFVNSVIIKGKVVFHISGSSTSLNLYPRPEDSEAFNL